MKQHKTYTSNPLVVIQVSNNIVYYDVIFLNILKVWKLNLFRMSNLPFLFLQTWKNLSLHKVDHSMSEAPGVFMFNKKY